MIFPLSFRALHLWAYLLTLVTFSLTQDASAEALVTLKNGVTLDIRANLQPVYYYADTELLSERDLHDFRLRRARIRFKGSMDDWITFVLQTEHAEEPADANSDGRIIDAYVHLKPRHHAQFYFGQLMAPTLRQAITSAGGLLSIDRPGVIYKSLNWGTRALARFSTLTMDNTDAGLRGNVDVRDMGVMFMGVDGSDRPFHYKYYLGVFDGAQSAQSERVVARGQLNWGDPEPYHFHYATYFGQKNTISLGFTVDHQSRVATAGESGDDVDYAQHSVDFFMEKPIANTSLTLEAAWLDLDLDDAQILLDPLDLDAINSVDARSSQGQGYYLQTGLSIGHWQPWLGVEAWQSDAAEDNGDYKGYRLGVTYQFKGHRANIKLGYEHIDAEQAFSTALGAENSLDTLAAGVYVMF